MRGPTWSDHAGPKGKLEAGLQVYLLWFGDDGVAGGGELRDSLPGQACAQ